MLLAAAASACQPGPDADATAAPPAAQAQRGQRLLEQYQCGRCHAIPGVAAAQGRHGPPLERFGRRSYIAGALPNQADTLAHWIADPAALRPGTTMPAMGVSAADAADMAVYLLSLR